MRIILMGPPGAGKGTQAKNLSTQMGVPHVSTGDLFRREIAADTALGAEAASYINSGNYVPDDLTNRMVDRRLQESDCAKGFLLDGYPRTLEQIEALDVMMETHGHVIDLVIDITADYEAIVQRLFKRAQEEGREDDSETVIRHRLKVYAERTEPLVAVYRDRGILVSVDGLGSIAEVSARIHSAIPH